MSRYRAYEMYEVNLRSEGIVNTLELCQFILDRIKPEDRHNAEMYMRRIALSRFCDLNLDNRDPQKPDFYSSLDAYVYSVFTRTHSVDIGDVSTWSERKSKLIQETFKKRNK